MTERDSRALRSAQVPRRRRRYSEAEKKAILAEASAPGPLDGKVFVVTGANSGIGFEAVRGLAGAGAHVVLACRNEALANEAMGRVAAEHPKASLEFGALDLADLGSVRAFAAAFREKRPHLDGLVNNARSEEHTSEL